MPFVVEASIEIPTPKRYMMRLAKHFEHRTPVTRTEQSATLQFPEVLCALIATETRLCIKLRAPAAESLGRLQEVVIRHLRQVAAQETFEVLWGRVQAEDAVSAR